MGSAKPKFWQKPIPRAVLVFVVATFGPWLIRLLNLLRRTRFHNLEILDRCQQGGVIVCWHRYTLSLTPLLGKWRFAALVSTHRDGEFLARIFQKFGAFPVRGSSFHGGFGGLVGLVEAAKTGWPVVITPDGSRGPCYAFRGGALIIAHKTGQPIVPVGVAVSRCWTAGSWDRMVIPKPFSSVEVVFGEPLHVVTDETGALNQKASAKLARKALMEVVTQAETALRERTGKEPQSVWMPPEEPGARASAPPGHDRSEHGEHREAQ